MKQKSKPDEPKKPRRTESQQLRDMMQCIQLYYKEGASPLSQAEIASILEIDKSYVSRYLKQARAQRMVSVELNLPADQQLEIRLIRKYRLHDAIVVPAISEEYFTEKKLEAMKALPSLSAQLGRAAAQYLLSDRGRLRDRRALPWLKSNVGRDSVRDMPPAV